MNKKINFFFDVSNLIRRSLFIVKKTTEDFDIEKHAGLVQLKLIEDIQKLLSFAEGRVENTYYCFDNTSFRYLVREDYKGTRVRGENIDSLFISFLTFLRKKKQNTISIFGLEADDSIALLSEKFQDDYNIIVSADEDLQQLVNRTTSVLIPHNAQRKLVQVENSTPLNLQGIPIKITNPSFILVEKILKGCKGDNIKGIVPKGFRTKKIQEISNDIVLDSFESIALSLSRHGIDTTEIHSQLKMVWLNSKAIPKILVDEFNTLLFKQYTPLR